MFMKKTFFTIILSSISFASFSVSIPENSTQYCGITFPIDSCTMSNDCQETNELQTRTYIACNNSYLELEQAITKAPIGVKSFEGDFSKANSYLVYNFKYNSLLNMPTKMVVPYVDMVKSKALLDKNYNEFHKNNIFLKNAFDIYKPFNTPEKKANYSKVVKQQNDLAQTVANSQNSVNFMLYNESFYNMFLNTYKALYPTAIYNGILKNKKLSLYQCQFINVTEDFSTLQKENNFTCDTK